VCVCVCVCVGGSGSGSGDRECDRFVLRICTRCGVGVCGGRHHILFNNKRYTDVMKKQILLTCLTEVSGCEVCL